jgi:hypothetical protein
MDQHVPSKFTENLSILTAISGLNTTFHTRLKKGVVHSLYKTATITCQERKVVSEINHFNYDHQPNGYQLKFTDTVIKSVQISSQENDNTSFGSVAILYVKGICGKFKRVGNRYNIRKVFRTKHSLRTSLMSTKP